MRMWMVRAGQGGLRAEQFIKESHVAYGWAVGPLGDLATREDFKAALRRAQPDLSPAQVAAGAGMLHRFAREMRQGDAVVTYDPTQRRYHLGEVVGDCVPLLPQDPDFAYRLPVAWRAQVSRDALSTKARDTLGAIQALFEVPAFAREELLALPGGGGGAPAPEAPAQMASEEQDLAELRLDQVARSKELIKDKLIRMSWDEMQSLVAGILRAMGFRTTESPPGPDQGKDIVASPDGLGLQPPRIRVEVKHRRGTMGSKEVRSFLGGLHGVESGLFVSTGGFTREAKYDADRSKIPVTLVNLDRLVELVMERYEDFDPNARALIPLVRIYWPVG